MPVRRSFQNYSLSLLCFTSACWVESMSIWQKCVMGTHTAFAVDFLGRVWLRPLHVWKQKFTFSWVFKTHQALSSLAPLIIRRVGFHKHSLWVQESALSFILEISEMWVMINIEPFVCTIYIVQSKSKELEKLSQPIFTQLNIALMTHLNATCYHQMSHHAIIICSDAS